MRKILPFFLLYGTLLSGQSDTIRAHLALQLGLRIHDNTYEVGRAGGERKMLSSPVIGLMVQMPKIPLRVGVQTDFDFELTVVPDPDNPWFFHNTWIEYQLQTYYDFKRMSVGLGAYWKRRENFWNHEVPGFFFWKYKGIQLSAVLPLNWLDIEFRTKIGFSPIFAALGTSQHSILLLYNIDKRRLKQHRTGRFIANGIIGARFFPTKPIELLVGEDLVPVGTSALLGIEIMHRKSRISINAERDWWLAVNGGSFRRDIKGYINAAFIGAGYHFLLPNHRFLRLKLGCSAIIDYDKAVKIRVTTPHFNRLTTYQVKGIGASISYELLPNTDVEIKHTFPILGDRLFNPLRASVGLIYRYNTVR